MLNSWVIVTVQSLWPQRQVVPANGAVSLSEWCGKNILLRASNLRFETVFVIPRLHKVLKEITNLALRIQ